MFKLSQLALAALSSSSVLADSISAQCQGVTTPSGTIFNIGGLRTSQGYESAVQGQSTQTLHWNYCGSVGDTANRYAYITDTNPKRDDEFDVATEKIADAVNIRDEDSQKTTGVSFNQGSSTMCIAEQGSAVSSWAMKTNLICDESVTGAAEVESVTMEGCSYIVTLKTNEGCPDINIDVDLAMGWLSENTWAIGVFYLVAGPLIGLFGLGYFPYVTAGVIAIFVIAICSYIGMAAGWMTSTGGCIAVILVSLNLGIVAGCLIRRNIWLMVSLLGGVAGFFLGAIVYALIVACSSWNAIWGYWLIAVGLAALGVLATCFFGKGMVLLSTSMIGAYLFMRSWTLFFPGHYPSESEMIEGDVESDLTADACFWVFLGVFWTCFMGFSCFQRASGHEHEDLYDYKRSD